MTPNTKPHGPAPKYINKTARELLNHCFPGMIPALVIAEALREKAAREGRLVTNTRHKTTDIPGSACP